MAHEKLVLSVREVCSVTGFSRAWLYTEWKAGRGPVRTKAGTRTFVSQRALEAWLASLEVFDANSADRAEEGFEKPNAKTCAK